MRISDWSSDVCSSDLFDLLRRCLPDRLIIAVKDGKIIADGAAEAAKPQHHGFKELTVFPRDADSEPSLFHAKGHLIGPFVTVSMFALRREMVFLQQVENGNPAFLLNISIAPDDGLLVERNIYDARLGHWSSPLRGLRGKDHRQKTIHKLCPIYPQACKIGRASRREKECQFV